MKARVLFLCTGNSARSQMAEGWLRHLAGDRFEVFSAGTHPVGLNPGSVDAMAEVGIDISAHRSKQVSEFLTQPFDHVITVCDRAKESCPRWPGSTHLLHWSFDDPAAATDSDATRLQLFRRVRDEILGQIKGFLDQEGQPLAAGPR
ncbi:MAG: arsenate reductase ArsC [Nitrospira sp.]|nr:arsenate reductase ArsC [Nitrospira sp.]MBP6604583.1 arsenate reductase ArsC [Nitrospira sp.]HQY58398.1 arsenate reductase ArsC [Nitrospira sp.]